MSIRMTGRRKKRPHKQVNMGPTKSSIQCEFNHRYPRGRPSALSEIWLLFEYSIHRLYICYTYQVRVTVPWCTAWLLTALGQSILCCKLLMYLRCQRTIVSDPEFQTYVILNLPGLWEKLRACVRKAVREVNYCRIRHVYGLPKIRDLILSGADALRKSGRERLFCIIILNDSHVYKYIDLKWLGHDK